MSDLAAAPVATPAAPAQTSDAAKPPEVANPAGPEPPEEFDEYPVDGKMVRLSKTQARTAVQKGLAADKRIQTAAETQKKLDALFAEFEADPEAAMRKAGKDPEKILAALIERKAKQALMTPEQRERAKLEEERDTLKADKEKREAETKAKADAELDEHNQKSLEVQLIGAADEHGLDESPETLEGLCDVALDLINLGLNPSANQVAQEYIRREQEHLEARDRKLLPKLKGARLVTYLKTHAAAMLKLPAAELLELLGPEGVKAIQAATLTKLPGPAAVKPKSAPVAPPPRNGAGRFISEGQFDKKFPR